MICIRVHNLQPDLVSQISMAAAKSTDRPRTSITFVFFVEGILDPYDLHLDSADEELLSPTFSLSESYGRS